MRNSTSQSVVRHAATMGLLLVASVASAQNVALEGDVQSVVVASDPAANSWNNLQYLADRTPGSNYNGIVNLWFRNAAGAVIHGCSGSNLGGGQILTAAHCVSNGTANIAASFTARFYQDGTGWVDVSGTTMVAKPGYNGAVINENDVAVLTLGSAAPVWARSYSLATGDVLGLAETFAGYGRTGNGTTGATITNNQFNDAALLRRGLNMFESTCNTAGFCATSGNPDPGAFGGVLVSDFDHSGASDPGFMCNNLGFCQPGFAANEEVAIGPGDSGGASFLNNWTITGVASWTQTTGGVGGYYGHVQGHTCVAAVADNAGCMSNYEWVNSQVTPEPASLVLLATGLIGVVGVARRRV